MAKIVKTADKGIAGFEKIFIEDPRRAIVIGVFIVLVIVVLVVFWNRIKAAFQSLVNKGANVTALNEHEAETGERPTLSTVTYTALANKLYQAFKGLGTDEDAVYKVFNQLNNTADVLKLISVYGLKDGHDLDWWMRSELNRWELKKVNTIMSNKGIAYAF